jgi:hypothetical protein
MNTRVSIRVRGLHPVSNVQITIFPTFAFTVGTPQQPVIEHGMQCFANRVVQGAASIAEVSIIKRIHFQAQTMLMADIRKQATAGDVSEPSKSLPYVEKKRRLDAQQVQTTGLSHVHEQRASLHTSSLTCVFARRSLMP